MTISDTRQQAGHDRVASMKGAGEPSDPLGVLPGGDFHAGGNADSGTQAEGEEAQEAGRRKGPGPPGCSWPLLSLV